MFSDEAARLSQTQLHESRVADNDRLQSQQFVEVHGMAAGFADGPPPTLKAVLRRVFALDRIAGARVLE